MEIIGLQTINNRGNFSYSTVFEFYDRNGAGGIFIFGKIGMGRAGRVAMNRINFTVDTVQEGIHGMTPCRQQATSRFLFFNIPPVLPVRWPDTVVIINFRIMNFPQ